MIYYLVHDLSGNVIGSGETNNDELIDPSTIECTAEQNANPYAWQVDLTQTPPALVATINCTTLRANKLAEINAACDAAVGTLRATYPDNEVASWDKQEREAEAFTASNAASTPLLSALAAARGVSLSDLTGRVLQKSAAFAQQSGALIGKRQALEDQLNAIADSDPDAAAKIAVIQWS